MEQLGLDEDDFNNNDDEDDLEEEFMSTLDHPIKHIAD